MRIHVASLTGTHVLDLARELERVQLLGTYYSALPSFRVRGLPPSRVHGHPFLLLPQYLLRRAGLDRFQPDIVWSTLEAFDRWLSRTVDRCDVFHAASGCGLRSFRRVKSEYGALTVCDRGSTHIRVQDELLRDEFARWGIAYRGIDPRGIAKDEAEYEESDVIVVPSTFVYESFVEAGVDPHKVVVIPYGVRLESFFPTPKRDEIFRILCVARIMVRKGIRYLLEATSRLTLPQSEVVLVGDLTHESKELLAPYEGRFRLHPPVSRHTHELRELYAQASVLVLPSIEEGFGLVIGEAMACGVPIIATTHTGAAQAITDGIEGFIVPVRSPEAIRERIEYLYRHPAERTAMGLAALERMRSLRGWGRYTDQMSEMYRQRTAAARRGAAARPLKTQ